VKGNEEAIKHEQSRGTGNTGTLHGMTYKQQTKNTTQKTERWVTRAIPPSPQKTRGGACARED
jgi:hypothetical protein